MPLKCWCNSEQFVDGPHLDYGQCKYCGTLMSRRSPDQETLKDYYGCESYWRGEVVNRYGFPPIEQRARNDFHDRIPHWMEAVKRLAPDAKSILEIGCCHGGFLSLCKDKGFNKTVGIEVDVETCLFAKRTFGLEEVYAGLFPDVYLQGYFDVICGFDVLEHFSNPLEALVAAAERLTPDGIVMWQTPLYKPIEGWPHFKPDEHFYLFDEESVKKLMFAAGLTCNIEPACFPNDMMVWGRVDP